MRGISFGLLLMAATAPAQQQAALQPVQQQSVPPAINRGPTIGVIDFYGLRKVSEADVRRKLGAREGDLLPPSKGDVEERLDELSGVVESHLEAVCCQNGKVTLYVGIEERGAPHFDLHDPPDGDAVLPGEVSSAYRNFLKAYDNATRQGYTKEDLTQGRARSEDMATRAIQDMFPAMVQDHMNEIRAVLRGSGDEEQRAMAAYVIGYAPDKPSVVNDLQYALRDYDPGVRLNAGRSLVAFAIAGVKVEATWFIEMLNSLSWTDRTRSLAALELLTDARDKAVFDQMRTRALQSLVEMARWKTLKDALPAYILLGRMAGIPEQEIQARWSRGDRESVIAQALKTK